MIELDVTRRAHEYLGALTAQGYDVTVPEDYREIPALVLRTGRPFQNPMHAVSRNDFGKDDAFWLFLTKDGQAVAGCAAVFYDLRHDDFADFLRRTSAQQYQRHDPIERIAPPVLERLRGRLIYVGEMQVHQDFRGNLPVLRAYARMMLSLCALKWSFDFIYAFVPTQHRRLIELYGFNWWVERAIEWRPPEPAGRLSSHILCGISAGDFGHHWSLPYSPSSGPPGRK